jgi:hypothetical protein
MRKRHMSGNELVIAEKDRWFRDGVDVDTLDVADRDG